MKLQLASCTRLLFSHTCISLLLFPSIDCLGKIVIFVGEELCTQHLGWTNKVPAWSTVSASPGYEEMQEDPPQELSEAHCPAQPASPSQSSSTRKTKPEVPYPSDTMTFFSSHFCVFGPCHFLSLTFFHDCMVVFCAISHRFLSPASSSLRYLRLHARSWKPLCTFPHLPAPCPSPIPMPPAPASASTKRNF